MNKMPAPNPKAEDRAERGARLLLTMAGACPLALLPAPAAIPAAVAVAIVLLRILRRP